MMNQKRTELRIIAPAMMMRANRYKAFTLVEILVTLAVILILAGSLIGAGKYLRTQAQRQLTQSTIDVIVMALQQYYDETGSFPPAITSASVLGTELSSSVTATVTVSQGTHPTDATVDAVWWSSESLFFFLERVPESKAIIGGLSNQMLGSKDSSGVHLQVTVTYASATVYDWVRFLDAWGNTIRYSYSTGDTFPVVCSAGPDKKFDTSDDLVSR